MSIVPNVIIAVMFAKSAVALICAQTDNNGNLSYPKCRECEYCVTVTRLQPSPNALGAARYGATQMVEDTGHYSAIFAEDDESFKTMSVCVIEKYTMEQSEPEMMLRCMCNTNRCNAPDSHKWNEKAVKLITPEQ